MLNILAVVLFALSSIVPGTSKLSQFSHDLTQKVAANQTPATRSSVATIEYAPQPTEKPRATPLLVSASAASLYDRDSATFLFEKNSHTKRAIASITKIATALTLLEHHKLDETVTVPNLPPAGPFDQSLRIQSGDQFSLREALRGMLIYSANDMAQALAIWDSGSEAAFAQKMNVEADTWGLSDTNFKNPTGLDAEGAHSSTHDLTILADLLLQDEFFKTTVDTPRASIRTLAGKAYLATTTDQLLGNGTVFGIKTGYTLNAGESFLSLGKRGGHELIGVVLDSPDRFKETQTMLNWAFANYIWK